MDKVMSIDMPKWFHREKRVRGTPSDVDRIEVSYDEVADATRVGVVDDEVREMLVTRLRNEPKEVEIELEKFAGIPRGIEERGTFPGLYAVGEKFLQPPSPTLLRIRRRHRKTL